MPYAGAVPPMAAPYAGAVPPVAAPYVGAVPPVAAPFGAPVSAKQQIDALKGQAEYFAEVLEGIRQQIQELEKEAEKK